MLNVEFEFGIAPPHLARRAPRGTTVPESGEPTGTVTAALTCKVACSRGATRPPRTAKTEITRGLEVRMMTGGHRWPVRPGPVLLPSAVAQTGLRLPRHRASQSPGSDCRRASRGSHRLSEYGAFVPCQRLTLSRVGPAVGHAVAPLAHGPNENCQAIIASFCPTRHGRRSPCRRVARRVQSYTATAHRLNSGRWRRTGPTVHSHLPVAKPTPRHPTPPPHHHLQHHFKT